MALVQSLLQRLLHHRPPGSFSRCMMRSGFRQQHLGPPGVAMGHGLQDPLKIGSLDGSCIDELLEPLELLCF